MALNCSAYLSLRAEPTAVEKKCSSSVISGGTMATRVKRFVRLDNESPNLLQERQIRELRNIVNESVRETFVNLTLATKPPVSCVG